MPKRNKRKFGAALPVIVVVFVLMVFGGGILRDPVPGIVPFLQSVSYIGLCIAWGISVRRRVMQVQVRRQLTAAAGLMVFWFALRTVKYDYAEALVLRRYLWYLYYFPMLFIPLYALFTAMMLGKAEGAGLPKYTAVPAGISLALFVFVITNDRHQLVFTFPEGKPWIDADYGYGPVYYVIVAWLIFCGLAILATLLFKCRIPHSRQYIWLPGVPIAVLVIYTVLYLLRTDWLFAFFADLPAVFCLLYAAVIESCMQTGLIRTNTGYDMLFEAATFRAQITDKDWNTRYASASSSLGADILSKAKDAPMLLDRNTRLKTNEISSGYVAWQEDVTELAGALEQLEENRQKLEEENFIEQEALRTKREMLQLQEENRLYDLIGNHTQPQVKLLDKLLDEYEKSSGENTRRRLLAKICVIGAYVKRSGNLLLIGESSERMPILELTKAVEESLQNLELTETECGLTCTAETDIPSGIAVEAYAFFEQLVEAAIGRLDYLWVNFRIREQELLLHMELETDIDFSHLSDSAEIRSEDGVWFVTAHYKLGGGTI